MAVVISFIVGLVIGITASWRFAKGHLSLLEREKSKNGADVLSAWNDHVSGKKKEREDKILAALAEKGRITNDEAQELLGVSDATATRYLQDLENLGKIEQSEARGRSVSYRLKNGPQ